MVLSKSIGISNDTQINETPINIKYTLQHLNNDSIHSINHSKQLPIQVIIHTQLLPLVEPEQPTIHTHPTRIVALPQPVRPPASERSETELTTLHSQLACSTAQQTTRLGVIYMITAVLGQVNRCYLRSSTLQVVRVGPHRT